MPPAHLNAIYDGEEAASIRNANNQNEITQEYDAQHPDMRVGITPQFKLFLETGQDRKRENLPQKYEVAALIPSEWAYDRMSV